MAEPQTMAAPAKVNLALHVTGQRADGYHLIDSLVVFAAAGDRLTAEPAETDEVRVTGRFAARVPLDGANIAVQARDALRARLGAAARPVRLVLEKNLPVAAGIGGGSSDAAAALRLLSRHWRADLGEEALAAVGLRLGADVPMCLAGRPLVARNIGDAVEPLPRFPALPMVLANPGAPLSTPAVFSALRTRDNPPLPRLAAAADRAALIDWLAATRNDLEAPARQLLPEIDDVLDALGRTGALVARMSGSGATCFGVYADSDAAGAAAAALAAAQPAWFVAATSSLAAQENDHG